MIFILCTTLIVSAKCEQPQPLPMGVIAAKGDDVYLKSSEWRVLVSMEAPRSDVGLLVNQIGDRIKQSKLAERFKSQYLARIESLRESPTSFVWHQTDLNVKQRKKRGLLNFVGEIGKQLFGLSTEAEVEELRQYIEKCQQSQESFYVDFNNLVAVINDSVEAINVNSRNIEKLQQQLADVMEGTVFRVILYDSIGDLERAAYRRDRQEDRWARARATLEQATLTEEIFPIEYLKQILKDIPVPIPAEWYYQHAKVEAKWAEASRLVYLVTISIPDPDVYFEYRLKTIPMPLGNVTSELKLNSILAVNTVTGRAFVPRECTGNQPKICNPTAVVDDGFICERQILAGGSQVEDCPTLITPDVKLWAEADGVNLLVSTPVKIDYSWYCRGQQAYTEQLNPGAWSIPVPGACEIKVGPYHLKGVQIHDEALHLNWKTVNLSIKPDNEWVTDLHLTPLETPREIRFNYLADVHALKPLPPPVWHEKPTPAWVWLTVLLTMALVLGLCFCLYIYRKKLQRFWRLLECCKINRPDEPRVQLTIAAGPSSERTVTISKVGHVPEAVPMDNKAEVHVTADMQKVVNQVYREHPSLPVPTVKATRVPVLGK